MAIQQALKQRRYADAIDATRKSAPNNAERDFAVGVLALEGLSDIQAAQKPKESVSQALSLLESAALSGHPQSIATLATTFSRGIGEMPGYTALIIPDGKLGACWEKAREQPANAKTCVKLRAGK